MQPQGGKGNERDGRDEACLPQVAPSQDGASFISFRLSVLGPYLAVLKKHFFHFLGESCGRAKSQTMLSCARPATFLLFYTFLLFCVLGTTPSDVQGFRGPYEVLRMEPRSAIYRVNTLPAILSLWPFSPYFTKSFICRTKIAGSHFVYILFGGHT